MSRNVTVREAGDKFEVSWLTTAGTTRTRPAPTIEAANKLAGWLEHVFLKLDRPMDAQLDEHAAVRAWQEACAAFFASPAGETLALGYLAERVDTCDVTESARGAFMRAVEKVR